MGDSRGLSILSAFLKEKIDDKGWSKKEFAEKAGLSQSYAYELLAEKREKIPGDDTLKDISKALDLTDKERKYILKIAEIEREKDSPIYPGDPDAPALPGEDEPPKPPPEPPPPVEKKPWYKNKTVIIALLIGFIVGMLFGCCGSTVFAGYIAEFIGCQGYY